MSKKAFILLLTLCVLTLINAGVFIKDTIYGPDFVIGKPQMPPANALLAKQLADCFWDPIMYSGNGSQFKLKTAVENYMRLDDNLTPDEIEKVNHLADRLCLPRYEHYHKTPVVYIVPD